MGCWHSACMALGAVQPLLEAKMHVFEQMPNIRLCNNDPTSWHQMQSLQPAASTLCQLDTVKPPS